MSYILDALRKSDQQRQRGTAPTLQSAHFAPVAREPRVRWMHALAGIVLAGTAFGIGWVRPWHSEPLQLVADKPADPIASQPQSVAPEIRRTPSASVDPSPPAEAPTSPRTEAPKPKSKQDPPRSVASRASQAPAPVETGEAAAEKPAETLIAAPAQDEKVLNLADLPSSVRQELPRISISVHAYSRTPKDRLVGVNDRLLHEGDTLAPQLVLEKITPDGMIFSYKGMRFQRGVQ